MEEIAVRILRHALPGNFPTQCFALILASALMPGHPASGASRSDEIPDPSSGVRIYRGVSRYGLPVVVLTNLDEAGNRLPSPGDAAGGAAGSGRAASPCDGEDMSRATPESADANRASGTPASPPAAPFKVVVNQGEGTGEVDARDVERSEEHTSELQSLAYLVCRLLLEKKKKRTCAECITY